MLGDDERPRLGQIEHLPGAVADARVRIQARAAPGAGRRVMIDHDVGIGDLPQRLAWPFCPPGFLPDRSRRLVTRAGFFSPSLDGGLPLFELFNPSRRSSSASRAFSDAFSACRAATSARRSSIDGARGGDSRVIRCLNRNPSPPSREFFRRTPLSPNLGSYSLSSASKPQIRSHPLVVELCCFS